MNEDQATPQDAAAAFWRSTRARHPPLGAAVAADAVTFAQHRLEPVPRPGVETLRYALRLAWVSDAFLGLALYRVKTALQRRGVPVLPALAHRLAIVLAQVSIGDPVVVEAGVYVPHGQIVLDGIVEVGTGTVLAPFVVVGLLAGELRGPVLERAVEVGAGAKILGPVRIGEGAKVGAGAVVVDDVPPGATVTGVPAAPVHRAGR